MSVAFWIFLSGLIKSKFFTSWLETWIWTESLGLNFHLLLRRIQVQTLSGLRFSLLSLSSSVYIWPVAFMQEKERDFEEHSDWAWFTLRSLAYSSTPLSGILGNVVHRASPWGKQYQMVNISAVRDHAAKSPGHRNLRQYNCAPKSGLWLCACAVCRGCFSKREPVRLYTAGLVGTGRWNGDMHWERSLASGCWDLGCRNNGNKNGWELGFLF